MKTLWKAAAVSVLTAVALAWTPGAEAAEGKGKVAGKARPPTCSGQIVSISGDCIVVKNKNGEQKFAINDKTKFGTTTEPKKCDDFKAGDKVTVSFKEDGDKKCALSVRTTPPPKPKGDKK
ncbi:MAG: hypothetical protein HZA91_19570 [Verrucomicrobia bacterium]|nr:hypothetical protein [Verrucomicrobiota bacterium]